MNEEKDNSSQQSSFSGSSGCGGPSEAEINLMLEKVESDCAGIGQYPHWGRGVVAGIAAGVVIGLLLWALYNGRETGWFILGGGLVGAVCFFAAFAFIVRK